MKITVKTEISAQPTRPSVLVASKNELGVENKFAIALASSKGVGEKTSKNQVDRKKEASPSPDLPAANRPSAIAPQSTKPSLDWRGALGSMVLGSSNHISESGGTESANTQMRVPDLTNLSVTLAGMVPSSCDTADTTTPDVTQAGDVDISPPQCAPLPVASRLVSGGGDSTGARSEMVDPPFVAMSSSGAGAMHSHSMEDIEGNSKRSEVPLLPEGVTAAAGSLGMSREAVGCTKPGTKDSTVDRREAAGNEGSVSEETTPTGGQAATTASIPALSQPTPQTAMLTPRWSFQAAEATNGQTGSDRSVGVTRNRTEVGEQGSFGKGRPDVADARSNQTSSEGKARAAGAATESLPARIPEGTVAGDATPGGWVDRAGNGSSTQPVAQAVADTMSGQSGQGASVSQSAPANSATHTVTLATEAEAISSVSGAQLIQSMRHSEMRVGMHSTEFGDISVTTSLNRQMLSAQISTDHTELGRALAIHMPAIEDRLSAAYGVPARVEIRGGSNDNGSSFDNNGQQSNENRQSRTDRSASLGKSMVGPTSTPANSMNHYHAAEDGRLDIRI